MVNPAQRRQLDKHYNDEEGECWATRLHSVPEILQVSRRQLSTVRAAINAGAALMRHKQNLRKP